MSKARSNRRPQARKGYTVVKPFRASGSDRAERRAAAQARAARRAVRQGA